MLKNNGKMIIGRNLIFCLCVICLMFTAFGLCVEHSFAVELNETADEMDLNSDDMEKLENSQNNEILEVDSQDSQEMLGNTIKPKANTYQSIQEAVNSANAGDTIKLSGTYTSSGTKVTINKKLTIIGDPSATLDGKKLSVAIFINEKGAGTVIKNLKFTNGKGDIGSCLIIDSKNIVVQKCVFEDNHANRGGTINTKYNLDNAAGLIIENCEFRRNTAYHDGFEDFSCGAALTVYGKNSEIRNCVFEDNWVKGKSESYGGAIQVGLDEAGSNAKVINCVFRNNHAYSIDGHSHGGAGCVRDGTSYINCLFIGNGADEGGALTFHASGEIRNCTFINNTAKEFGGALSTGYLYEYMELTVNDCNFDGNSALRGGAIQVNGLNVVIEDSRFKSNHATENGGAIHIEAEDVTIKDSLFNSNVANVDGGAVYIEGKNTLVKNSSFISNEAIPDVNKLNDGLGGAIYINSSQASINDNVFRFNTARNGSSIYYDEDGEKLTLQNNELFQNQAWVYALPISSEDINYGENEEITVTLFGGNNIADYDNLEVSNAIYNDADSVNIVVNGQYPRQGATNNGDLYQDSREYNIDVLLTVQHEDGTVVYNDTGHTSYLGEIKVDFDDLKPGKYYVSAKHYEDTYYKGISNTTTFTVKPQVDNEVKKSVSNDNPNFEDVITWTITIKNNGPNDSTNVVANDVLPEGLIWLSDTSEGKYDHKTGLLTIGDLRVNETYSFNIVTVVNVTGKIVNEVNLTSDEFDTNTSNNFAEKSIFVNPSSDLAVFKSVSDSQPKYGDYITWTIVISNNGPDTAHDIEMHDVLPKSLIYVDSDGDYDETSGVWKIATLKNGEKTTLNIKCIVNETGMIENFVMVNATEYDYDLTNNNDTERIFVQYTSDLSIRKSVNASRVNYGDLVKWFLTVSNNGPDAATNIEVFDDLPEGFSYVDSSVEYDDGTFRIDRLEVGEEVTIELITLVEATGNFTNYANVTSDGFDFNLTNNEDNESIFVNPMADLSVVKTVSDSNPGFNDVITWTIEVTNNGPDVAHNITIYDLFSSFLIWLDDDSSGDYNPKTGMLILDELDVDETFVLNIECMVNSTGIIYNSVRVNATEFDYDLSNNNDTEEISVDPTCDLAIKKTVNASSVNYGDLVKWFLIISNNGPDAATNIEVCDVLPEGFSYVDSSVEYDDGTFRIDCLEVGEELTIELVTLVGATGNFTNYANVSSEVSDFNLTNNDDNESIFVNPMADLSVVKTVSNSNPKYRDTVIWTINITNNGPDVAHNVTVCDLLFSSLIWISDDSSGEYNPKTGKMTIKELDIDESFVLNIECIVNSTGLIRNGVSVNATEFDCDLSNNNDTEEISVDPSSDLAIEKSVNASSVNYGDLVKWFLTVSNNGPDVATNIEVCDTLPEGFKYVDSSIEYDEGTFRIDKLDVGNEIVIEIITLVETTGEFTNYANVSCDEYDFNLTNNEDNESIFVNPMADLSVVKTVSDSNPKYQDTVMWTINITNNGLDVAHNVTVCDLLSDSLIWIGDDSSGKYDFKTGMFVLDELDVGESFVLNIECIVNSTGLIRNGVSVNASEFDCDLSNNNDTEEISVDPSCDLEIKKTVNASSVNYGDLVKWLLTVSNNGPDVATNIEVKDVLPDGFRYVDSSIEYDDGTFRIACLEVGKATVIEIITLVETTGEFTNYANVSCDEYDFNLTNNEDNESIFVNPMADLSVVKTVSNSNPKYQDTVIWTINITNNGLDVAHNVTVCDLLSDSLIWIGDDSSGKYDPKTGKMTIKELDVNQSFVLNIECRVNATDLINNFVSVNASEYDFNLTNNFDNVTIDVGKSADVSVIKLVNNSAPNYNDLVKWTLIISNSGPDKANNIYVQDPLPVGLVFINYTSTKGIYYNGLWVMCCLENGENETLEIICRVNKTGKINNIATIHADEYDSNEDNNIDNESIDVPPACDLQVIIEANDTAPLFGKKVNWNIVVKNNGPDNATNVKLEDILPEELTYVEYDSSTGIYDNDVWDIGSLNVGNQVTLNIVTIPNDLGIIINKVKVNSTEYDWNMTNNYDYASIDVKAVADLSITKLVDNTSPKYGETIKWTLIVHNEGPNIANNVVVRDILPEGLAFVSSDGKYRDGIWKIGTMNVGETKKLEIVSKVTSTGRIINLAGVSGDEFDPDESNNNAKQSISVGSASDLSITKIASRYKYDVGDVIEYMIEVVNNGPDTAYNVKVDEILDDLLKLKSFKVSRGKFDKSDYVWTIKKLGYGDYARLYIKAIATGPGIIKNTVSVTSDCFDYDMSNNNDFAIVKAVNKALNKQSNEPKDEKTHVHKHELSNLEKHPTANPLAILAWSCVFSIIFLGEIISKRR